MDLQDEDKNVIDVENGDNIEKITPNNEEEKNNLDIGTNNEYISSLESEVENNKIVKYDNKDKKHLIKNKKVRITVICVTVILINIIILFSVIACINKFNSKVYKNVFLLGQDMSGKTLEDVAKFIEENSQSLINEEKVSVYQADENIYTINSKDIGFNLDIEKTAQNIMDFGRSGNIFSDNFSIIKALFNKQDIKAMYTFNNEEIQKMLENIDITINDRYVDDSYRIDEATNKLVITKGKTGNSLDYNVEKQKIINAFSNNDTDKIKLDVIQKEPTMLDIEKIHSEVKREAKDAYIDESSKPAKIVGEVIGLDFDTNALKELLQKEENKVDGKVIEFDLAVTQPNKKLADLSYALYKDKLGGYTTYFSPSLKGRSRNLEIALGFMNGKVVMPGEIFSYNKTVGEITEAKGYQMASTFVGGREVMDIGGGICQTVSTLYNTVLFANLEIVERHQHGLPVGYVPPSRDATIYMPSLDFKFKNNRNYPIKIETSFSWSGNLNISIYGTKEENEYEVILSHKVLRTIPFNTKYTYDANIAKGNQSVVTKGVQGYASEGYITKKLNGVVVSSGILSKDTYNPQNQTIVVGTKEGNYTNSQ